ncbi:MAG: hypothetical protein C5B54_02445 [Acidobacteria bacterium]|nr:MAG: hypothetical protein C5B54_02445 [Acidobacteriota bacterium]
MPLQQIIPTFMALNASDDVSPSHYVNIRTGDPVFAGGLNGGDYFDLTEKEANDLSYKTNGILHSGRYRRVQIYHTATPSLVAAGLVGFMVAALAPEVNIVTTASQGLHNVRPVIFLNTVTPGNWCFIIELGIANIRMSGTGAAGADIGVTTTTGMGTAGTTPAIGKLLEASTANTTHRVLLNLPVVQG